MESGDAGPDAGDAAPLLSEETPPPQTTPLPQQPRPVTAPLRPCGHGRRRPVADAAGDDDIGGAWPRRFSRRGRAPAAGAAGSTVTFAEALAAAWASGWGKLLPWNTRASVAALRPRRPRLSPCSLGAQPLAVPAAPPTAAQQAAERVRAAKAAIDKMFTAGLDFDDLSDLKSRLAALRADGAPAEAEGLAVKAQKLIIAEAEANFEQGEIQTGVARYKAAITLHDKPRARRAGRGARARADRPHQAGRLLAVRWAREGVALNNDETTHAARGMLYAAHECKVR